MSSEGSVLTLRESRRPGVWARGQACVLPAAARRCGGRTRVLSSLSPDVLLSGLCISVPFHPRINPLRSWASRGSPASLGGGGHGALWFQGGSSPTEGGGRGRSGPRGREPRALLARLSAQAPASFPGREDRHRGSDRHRRRLAHRCPCAHVLLPLRLLQTGQST